METAQADSDNREREPAASAAVPSDSGLLDTVQAVWQDLRGLARDQLELAALETRRAGKSLALIVVYAVGIALLLVTAWLGLMAAGVLWLTEIGCNGSLAVLGAVALNIGAAVGLFTLIRSNSRNLGFPATVQSLKADASVFALPDKS